MSAITPETLRALRVCYLSDPKPLQCSECAEPMFFASRDPEFAEECYECASGNPYHARYLKVGDPDVIALLDAYEAMMHGARSLYSAMSEARAAGTTQWRTDGAIEAAYAALEAVVR